MIGEHIGPYRLLSSLGDGAVHRATGPDGSSGNVASTTSTRWTVSASDTW